MSDKVLIMTILNFKYDPSGKNKSRIGEINKYLTGTGKTNIFKDILKKYGNNDLTFLAFARIRNPKKSNEGGKKGSRPATGVIVIYEYSGDELTQICTGIREILNEKKKTKYLGWSDFKIYTLEECSSYL